MRLGRIPYINCFPVYKGIDTGTVPFDGQLISGVPSKLNELMAAGMLDVSVVSAVEYARSPERYFLLPDLAISCNGPVRSVLLLSSLPAENLNGATVVVSRSSMTSVALLELLFRHVWRCQPHFLAGDAELGDIHNFANEPHSARLVIGDAALSVSASPSEAYPHIYDLGTIWKEWTDLPFVFALWVAQRTTDVRDSLLTHTALLQSRSWGLANIPTLATEAERVSSISAQICAEYFAGLDYRLSALHLAGLTEFFRRLATDGTIRKSSLEFLPAA